MKKTMTKEEFYKFKFNGDLYESLSEAGISFDIYTDSDGQIIKPGDEVLDKDGRSAGILIGFDENRYETSRGLIEKVYKLPTEVWEPVPMEDIDFTHPVWQVDIFKWVKTRVTNGKPEGVRK